MKFDALFDLLRYAFCGLTVGWREGLVVAESATSEPNLPVTIWAGESCVYRHLLHTLAKVPAEVCRVAVVSSFVTPRVDHKSNFLQK